MQLSRKMKTALSYFRNLIFRGDNMAWTYGFFNSVDGDRTYNAQQMSEIFDGLITEGVYESVGNKLAVQPNEGMTIQINTGRGFVGKHWVKNDSIYTHTLEASDVLLNRYCAVCIRADDTDSVRNAVPYFKYSEFATNPVKPTMTRTEKITERCLAYIYIKAKAKTITAADIEDTRGDTNLCGWVTGLIDQVDTTTLWEQYKAEWNTFMDDNEAEIEAVTEAKNAANTAATNATTQANYAKTQGDNAKTQAANAQTQATAAETAATNANTQATNAQTQATAAQAAAERATRAAENAEVTDIGAVNTRIDNLRPGVTNLFLNSTDYSGNMWFQDVATITNDMYNGTKIYRVSGAWADCGYFIKNLVERNILKVGDTLTCSCYARTDNPTTIKFQFFCPTIYGTIGDLTEEWKRFSYTFTVTEDFMAITEAIRANTIRFEPQSACKSGYYVYVANLMLTKGNMIVDWSPAPEDYLDTIVKSTGTFNGTAWIEQADGTYTQTIVVNGVTSLNNIAVTPVSEYKDTYAAMGCEAIGQGTNNVTFKCYNPQEVAAKVDVLIFNA